MTKEHTLLSLASKTVRMQADIDKLTASVSVLRALLVLQVAGEREDRQKLLLKHLLETEERLSTGDSEQRLNARIIDALKHWNPDRSTS